MTATCGEFARTVELEANVTTGFNGIEGIGMDGKAVRSVEYYSADGLRVYRPQHGQICIRRTVYADGTTAVDRVVVR